MRKRLLAIIATAAMVVAMVPSMVFADTDVAKIGSTGYATLEDAVNAANTADKAVTIELLKDVELAKGIKIQNTGGNAVTISGNGYDITPKASATFTGLIVNVKTDLIIANVTFDGFETTTDVLCVYQGADLTLTNCKILNCNCRTVVSAASGYVDTLSITGSSFENNVAKRGIVYSGGSANSSTTISDCVFDKNTCTAAAAPISLPGKVSIINSKFTGNKTTTAVTNQYAASAAYCWGEDVAITGNTVTGNTIEATNPSVTGVAALIVTTGEKNIDLSGNNIDSTNVVKTKESAEGALNEVNDAAVFVRDNGTGKVVISSGAMAGTITSSTGEGVSITGGTFDKDVSDFISGDLVQDKETGEIVSPEDNNKTEEVKKPESSPNTGDNSVAPFAIAGIALAAMAAVVATRRREN